LQANSRSIAQIAVRLGYSDPSHFSRAFRRWEGISPRSYRFQGSD
jgi:AraC-like DNA-binding protein